MDNITNYERIKSMNVEEMASFLSDIQWDSDEPTTQEMYEWLIAKSFEHNNFKYDYKIKEVLGETN